MKRLRIERLSLSSLYLFSLEELLHCCEGGVDLEDPAGLVPALGEPDPPVDGPHSPHPLVSHQLPEQLVGGPGEVLHQRVPLDAASSLGCGRTRDVFLFAPQHRVSNFFRNKFDNKGGGEWFCPGCPRTPSPTCSHRTGSVA